MYGLEWMDMDEALDLLRVSADNAALIESFADSIPHYVEIVTGYPATRARGLECHETVKVLCRFLLEKWFDPDGTDAEQLDRVIESLKRATKALVISEGMDEG